MKISKIDLSWFRGAAEHVCLETDNKSVVIYGDNATGKSSFADGFEFIIAKGKIEHLAHEYKDREYKNCLRNTSAPVDAVATSTFNFDTGESVSVLIPNDESNYFESDPSDFLANIQSWQLEQHILRQNEIADFVEKTKKQKYSVLSPLLGLSYYEQIASNISSIKAQVETESRLEYLRGMENSKREEILQYIPDLGEDTIRSFVIERANKYGISPIEDVFKVAEQALKEVTQKEKDLAPDIQRTATARRIMNVNVIGDIEEFLRLYREIEEIRDEVIEHKINILEESTKFVNIQEEETIECPACGRQIPINDFREHVTSELESLREYNDFKKSIERIKLNISRKIEQIISFANSDMHFITWLNAPTKIKMKESFAYFESSDLRDASKKWNLEEVVKTGSGIEFLYGELRIDFAEEPRESEELIEDSSFFGAALNIREYENIKETINKIEILLSDLDTLYDTIRKKITDITKTTLDQITEDVRRIWTKLHPSEPIEDISLIQPTGNEMAIDIALKFYGTHQLSPRLTLSEGYRNSLGLSIFLALANQGDAKDHPIILDDIVSSLDSNHRGMLVDLLNDELADRQIILLTHDDAWHKSLLVLLDREKWKFFRLLPWEKPEVGIRLTPTHYTFSEANELLASYPRAAGNAVRAIMDTSLPQYVQKLELRLPFVWGPKSDNRTNHEFLERLIADGRASFKIKNDSGGWDICSDAISTWEDADRRLIAWADPSSHGGQISPTEVRKLIEVCEASLNYFKCPDCDTFIWRMEDGDRKLCRCGKIRWG